MSDQKNALILHLASGGAPLVFALSDQGATTLRPRLPDLLSTGGVDTPDLADGTTVAINYTHVVTAHLDSLPDHASVYGSPKRNRGFGV